MPTSTMERFEPPHDQVLTPEQQEQIIALAARLQAEAANRGPTFADLHAAATEAGIESEHLQAAYKQVLGEDKVQAPVADQRKEVSLREGLTFAAGYLGCMAMLLSLVRLRELGVNPAHELIGAIIYLLVLPSIFGAQFRSRRVAALSIVPLVVGFAGVSRFGLESVVQLMVVTMGIAASASTLKHHVQWHRVQGWVEERHIERLAGRALLAGSIAPVGLLVFGLAYLPLFWALGLASCFALGFSRANGRAMLEGGIILLCCHAAEALLRQWQHGHLLEVSPVVFAGGALVAALGVGASWLIRHRSLPPRQPTFH